MQKPEHWKQIELGDFLTPAQMKRAIELKTARAIHDEILAPEWKSIDNKIEQKTGQGGNDPMFFAYAIENAINQMGGK